MCTRMDTRYVAVSNCLAPYLVFPLALEFDPGVDAVPGGH